MTMSYSSLSHPLIKLGHAVTFSILVGFGSNLAQIQALDSRSPAVPSAAGKNLVGRDPDMLGDIPYASLLLKL